MQVINDFARVNIIAESYVFIFGILFIQFSPVRYQSGIIPVVHYRVKFIPTGVSIYIWTPV